MKVRYAENERRSESAKVSGEASHRLDLRDLLKRLDDQKKGDKKVNLLILSGAVAVALAVLLILSL